MSQQLPDFGKFKKEATIDQLRAITEGVDAYLELQVGLAQAEEAFRAVQKRVTHYEEHLIPEAMREAGVKEFTTTSGYKVKIKSDVRASIPVARQEEAFAWLEANGEGGLIKRTIEVAFAMGEDELARDLQRELTERELSVGSRKKVESSSLRALLRRLLEDKSKPVPMDIFGASEYDKADVSSPKEKGAKKAAPKNADF